MGLLPLLLAAWAPQSNAAPLPSPDVAEALETCSAGLFAAADRSGSERMAAYAASCASLYRQPACRAAVAGVMNVPVERRASHMAYTCRDAYCPTLAAPVPEMCSVSDPGVAEMARLWAPLQARILSDELGPAYADYEAMTEELARSAPPSPIYVVSRAPKAGPVVTIVPTAGRLMFRVGDDTVDLPADATAEALAERLRPLLAGNPGPDVVLVADITTDFATIRTTFDALSRLGFTKPRVTTPTP